MQLTLFYFLTSLCQSVIPLCLLFLYKPLFVCFVPRRFLDCHVFLMKTRTFYKNKTDANRFYFHPNRLNAICCATLSLENDLAKKNKQTNHLFHVLVIVVKKTLFLITVPTKFPSFLFCSRAPTFYYYHYLSK